MKKDKTRSLTLDRLNVGNGNGLVLIVKGDIVLQGTDGIVNSSHATMIHNHGVARDIQEAAGQELINQSAEWVEKNGEVTTGSAVVTGAGKIRSARKVIHAVGPQVCSGFPPSKEQCNQLESCMSQSLIAAGKHNLRSLSVPAISTGIFGFPVQRAASILLNTTVNYLRSTGDDTLKEVRFVLPENSDYITFCEELGEVFGADFMKTAGATLLKDDRETYAKPVSNRQKSLSHEGRKMKDSGDTKHGADWNVFASKLRIEQNDNEIKSIKDSNDPDGINSINILGDSVKITIVQGDIVKQKTDGVVNAANNRLAHGAGVAGAIRTAAGQMLVKESNALIRRNGTVATGSVAVTGAGNIEGARKVIHAVGPQVTGGFTPTKGQCDQLESCMFQSLAAAVGHELRSLSVPAISTGIFGFPVQRAASILLNATVEYFQKESQGFLQEVRFVLFDETAYSTFCKTLRDIHTSIYGNEFHVSPEVIQMSPVCDDSELSSDSRTFETSRDNTNFSAAGVLLYRFIAGELNVLVGVEGRGYEGMVWNILGGKRDRNETAISTAAREFWEESGKNYTLPQLKNLLSQNSCTPFWLGFGKYVLFLSPCPSQLEDIDVRYNNLRSKDRDSTMEMSSLLWARWNGLVSAACSSNPVYAIRTWRHEICYPLSKFLIKLLANEQLVNTIYTSAIPDVKRSIEYEIMKVKEEKHRKISLSEDQRLRLSMPALVPDTSPISTLTKTDPLYQQILTRVPSSHINNITTIRKVNVNVREAEHRKMEKQLNDEGKLQEIICPAYHGTPERWRATNIAFQGFNLSIKLNGRAHGDGVYTASTMDTPLSYCNDKGSILHMRCLRTESDYDNASPQRINVFRKPPQVLVTAIIDFSSEDSNESKNELVVREEARKAREMYDKQKQDLEEMEKAYITAAEASYRNAAQYYSDVLKSIKSSLEDEESDSVAAIKHWKRFEKDRCQFRSSPMAPIYADKRNVISSLQSHDVVIVTASTGSGKSTQLPQYLLDDVFANEPVRRIAVLEPKRFNCMSLAHRVSQERGHSVGGEVGYSLGLGDVCISSSTRIEYMTHGLFISRSKDMDSLVKQYCAVVLDEAHHRSVDVDICFGLLRQCLLHLEGQKSSDNWKRFKVVVASATLTSEQKEMYRNFLAPSPLSGYILEVCGHSFPVLNLYRPEAEPNWSEANSFETSKALASYATQVAIQLIQTNGANGNILIFMPGESVINQCIDSMCTWALFQDSKDEMKEKNVDICTIVVEMPATKKGGKKSNVRVGIYPFHAKVSEQKRQEMLLHKNQDCVIIFSTNVAETGLTLPNIRYVIDTGLERRVQWNNDTGMQEMRTVQITKSSMNQRSGRAGRVASGICVRLYSEETAQCFEDAPGPEIESGVLLKTVLKLYMMQKQNRGGVQFELLTEIPEEAKKSAEKSLQVLGALVSNSKSNELEVSPLGKTMFEIGLPLRISRFLIACNSLRCLGSGAIIAAMMSVPGALSFLPRKGSLPAYLGSEFLDQSGDHLSLLNIFVAFSKAKNKVFFCYKYRFDVEVLENASRCRNHLEVVFCKIKFDCVDDPTFQKEEIRQKLLQALCFGYSDQVMSSNAPGHPGQKFVRHYLSESDKIANSEAAHRMAAAAGLLPKHPPKDCGTSSNSAWQFVSGIGDAQESSDQKNYVSDDASSCDAKVTEQLAQLGPLDTLNLSSSSSLWGIDTLDNSSEQQFAIFCSILLTDTQKGPSVEMVSYVKDEAIIEASKQLGLDDDFARQRNRLCITHEEIPISNELRKFLMDKSGSEMKRHFTNFVQITACVLRAPDRLSISAPKYAMPMLKRRIEQLEETQEVNKQEIATIEFTNLTDKQVGNIIKLLGAGNKGQDKLEVVKMLNQTVDDYLGHNLQQQIQASDIRVDSGGKGVGSCTITISLFGPTKQLVSILLGVLQSWISDILRVPDSNIPLAVTLKQDCSPHTSVNLMKISAKTVPAWNSNDPRGSAMLHLAHVAVWKANCCVYGGFIRDYIVRNERANDVDVGYRTGQEGLENLHRILTEEIKRLGFKWTRKDGKGMANAIVVSHDDFESFDVDLVDLHAVKKIAPSPGVDCDVGNLILEVQEGNISPLQLKIKNRHLVSLVDSLSHCKMKEFVFYYEGRAAADSARLMKYLDRGWTCLNWLPEPLHNLVTDTGKGHLLRPLEKYRDPFY